MAKCKDCGATFDEESTEKMDCPNCGSRRRSHCATGAIVGVAGKANLRGKVYDPSRKPRRRAGIEFQIGDELSSKTGRWVDKFRKADRRNNQYVEIITDPKTGQVIHKCVEPLSEHRGHGSVKKRKK